MTGSLCHKVQIRLSLSGSCIIFCRLQNLHGFKPTKQVGLLGNFFAPLAFSKFQQKWAIWLTPSKRSALFTSSKLEMQLLYRIVTSAKPEPVKINKKYHVNDLWTGQDRIEY